ncbi:MAG TPA: hypothetical protein VE093_27085 [Polyangiaceae bacterium]|nr:hypothetical protein [Polyangiaceae bacterium]
MGAISRREWTTDVVTVRDAVNVTVSVRLDCNLVVPSSKVPTPKKPYVIKKLFERLRGGLDGAFEVSDEPHHLAESDVDLATRIVFAKSDNYLPIVYVSVDFMGQPRVDISALARTLSGVAHVVVEPSRSFSLNLAHKTWSNNVYGGAVGIYWGGEYVRLLTRDFSSRKDLEQEIEYRVRNAALYARSTKACTWAALAESISRKRIQELKDSGATVLDEYSKAFDTEIAALREQRADLESRLQHVQALNQQIAAKAVTSSSGPISMGKEQELYPGEFRDVLLALLIEARGRVYPEGRHKVMIESILAANVGTDTPVQMEQELKDCLSKAQIISGREKDRLKALGFTITEEGKHYKAVFRGDPRLTFSLFKTASDHRAGKNLASEMVRRLLK